MYLSPVFESRERSKALCGGMKVKEDAAEQDGLFRSRMSN